jgi:hypothetical protein
MRSAMLFALLFVALAGAPRLANAESKDDQWEAELAHAQTMIQAKTNEVRRLRKATDKLVESLNALARSKVVKLTPEFKREVALKRIHYYTQLGSLNASAAEMERTLPSKVAPIARQKVLNLLATLRGELRFTVVSLNHVAKSVNDL